MRFQEQKFPVSCKNSVLGISDLQGKDYTDSKSLLHSVQAAKTSRTEPWSLIHRADKYAFKSMHSLVHTYMMQREWGRGLAEWSNTSLLSMCRTAHLGLLLQTLHQCHLHCICRTHMSPRFITAQMKIQSYQSLALRKSQVAKPCTYALWGGGKNNPLTLFFPFLVALPWSFLW